jgi:hypothetical protein
MKNIDRLTSEFIKEIEVIDAIIVKSHKDGLNSTKSMIELVKEELKKVKANIEYWGTSEQIKSEDLIIDFFKIEAIHKESIEEYYERILQTKDFSLKVICGYENIDKWVNNRDIDEINLDELHCIYFENGDTKGQVMDLISNIDQSSYQILDNDEYELLKN